MFLTRIAAAAALTFALGAAALADQVTSFAPEGVAINGYDTVAYHTLGAPTPGSAEFTAEHDGVTWRFASAANRDAFVADPAKYAPAYGGYCAFGTSKGVKKATLPDQFKVVDGQLYLNSSAKAQENFLKDEPGVIGAADTNWTRIAPIPADKL